jgi:hypothetical protein
LYFVDDVVAVFVVSVRVELGHALLEVLFVALPDVELARTVEAFEEERGAVRVAADICDGERVFYVVNLLLCEVTEFFV